MSELLNLNIVCASSDAAVVMVAGEIDLSNRDELATALAGVGWARRITVDLRRCSFFDCSALHVLTQYAATMRRERRQLTVLADPTGRRLIGLAGLPYLLATPNLDANTPVSIAA